MIRHTFVLAGRSLTKTRRNPELLSDALFLPIIFLLMFVYLFGGAVSGSREEYLQFVFPGILVMTAMLAGLAATGLNINNDVKKGVFDRFRSLPINRAAPLFGSVLADAVRYVVALTVLFGVGYLMGFRVQTGLLPTLAACLLAVALGFALSWITVLVGVAFKEPAVVQSVAFLGIFPLAFGTNTAAPAATLPGWLQVWVDVNPASQTVEAVRGLLVGGPVAGHVTASLLWSVAIFAVFATWGMRVYLRRS